MRGGVRPDILIQPLDHAVVLKQGNEYAGAYHAELRVLPTHKRLGAFKDGLVGAHIELGLIVHLKLFLPDGVRKVLDQLLG